MKNTQYNGKFHVGQIVMHRNHECVVVECWNIGEGNGVTIRPTGNYGFEIDLFDYEV